MNYCVLLGPELHYLNLFCYWTTAGKVSIWKGWQAQCHCLQYCCTSWCSNTAVRQHFLHSVCSERIVSTLMSIQCWQYSSVDALFAYLMSCRSASLAPSTVISRPVTANPNCCIDISLTKNGSRLGRPYLGSPEKHSLLQHTVHCA